MERPRAVKWRCAVAVRRPRLAGGPLLVGRRSAARQGAYSGLCEVDADDSPTGAEGSLNTSNAQDSAHSAIPIGLREA